MRIPIPQKLRTPFAAVELFVLFNLGFLTLDVWIAHATNHFERAAEWIPFYFSIVAPVLLLVGFLFARTSRGIGFAVGWISVVVGVTGMVYHLQSHFFEEQTIRNLVYTAPFVAPLAYTGLGLLLILDRMMDSDALEWAQWVVFLALGGFAGNFALSLADHAQNGFFHRGEWIPVASSALACSFLLLLVLRPRDATLLHWSSAVVALQMAIGALGFLLHLRANFAKPANTLFDRFVYGAPIFAPLLFPNLAILAAIGMWAMWQSSRPQSRR